MFFTIKDAFLSIFNGYNSTLRGMVKTFTVTEHWGTTRLYVILRERMCTENSLLCQYCILPSKGFAHFKRVAMFSLKVDAVRLSFKKI